MYTIRREQMQAFERDAQRRFVEKQVDALAELYPETCERLGTEGSRALALASFERAVELGCRTAAEQLRYVHLVFAVDGKLDERPWAPAILEWPNAIAERLDALEARVVREKSES